MDIEYNKYLINCFENIYDDKFIIWKNKGTILELINCIKNNCLMYNDVSFEYKEKYNLSFTDDGIDCIDVNNNKIYQVKFYSKNKYISDHILGTFFKNILKLQKIKYEQKINFKFYLIHSQDVKFSNNIFDDLIYEEIKDDEIKNYIHNAYELFFDKLKDKELLNDLHNEIDNVFNNMIDNKYYNINKLKEIKNNLIDKIPKKNKEIEIKELYKHQKDLLNIMNTTKEKDNYFNLPCASGKTYVIELFSINNKDKKILILVPNILLAEQYKDNFKKNKININECWTNTDKIFNEEYNIYVCVYDSYDYIKQINFDYIIVDEAHHILKWMKESKKYKKAIEKEKENFIDNNGDNLEQINTNKLIYDDINNKDCIKFYFSATLLFINKEITYYYYMDKAIEDNIINDFNIVIHQIPEINDLNIIKTLQIHPEYKRILIYCNRIDKIQKLSKLFNKYNIPSDYLSSNIDKRKRKEILKKLYDGKLRLVFSVNTICEGIDIPNVDTCYFYDDKNSVISIVQCLGRIMRKSINKNKSYLLFFTDSLDNCNYDKYLNKINNYCNKFMDIKFNDVNVFKYIKYCKEDFNIKEDIEEEELNEDEDIIEEEDIKTVIMENVIKNLKVNDEEKIKLCKDFYNDFKRLPISKEIYKNFYIGSFINGLKKGSNKHLKNKVENIFNEKIENKIIKNKISNNDIIKLCEEYYNEFKRLPYETEIYKDWKIGIFIGGLKKGHRKELKNKIEEIFNEKIEYKTKTNNLNNKEKIQLCQEFYNLNKRLPKKNEEYKNFKINCFISNLKHGKNKELKNKIEKIFNEKIEVKKIIIDDKEKIKLCQEFYKINNRLPKDKEIYKDFNIGSFIYGLKDGKNKYLKEQVEEIFNCKIEKQYIHNNLFDEEKIKLCQEFYDEFKRLPTSKEIYKDWKIGNFIISLKIGQNKHLKNKIEEIFNEKIEKKIIIISDEEKIKLCQDFYYDFHRLPSYNEKYKDWKIGSFISRLKFGDNKSLKEIIEKIFNCKIEKQYIHNNLSDEEKIKLCQEFYEENKRIPKSEEQYKNWNIGKFIKGIRDGKNNYLKNQIEKIFNITFNINNNINNINNNNKVNLCKEFYNEFKRLPKNNDIYKDWKIGRFIDGIRYGQNKHLKEQIEKIFNEKINKIRTNNIKNDEEKIKLCKEFYNDFNRLPKQNEEYKNWKINNFIRGIKRGQNKHLKEQVEEIFNVKFDKEESSTKSKLEGVPAQLEQNEE